MFDLTSNFVFSVVGLHIGKCIDSDVTTDRGEVGG